MFRQVLRHFGRQVFFGQVAARDRESLGLGPISEALGQLLTSGADHLVVLDADQAPVGQIDLAAIRRAVEGAHG